MSGLACEPLLPVRYAALLAVLAAAGLLWCGWRSSAGVQRGRRMLLAALRLAAGLAAVALIVNPGRMVRGAVAEGRPVVAVLVDRSSSMAVEDADGRARLTAARDAALRFAGRMPAECDVRFLAFDAQVRAVERDEIARLDPAGAGTDLAAAVDGALDRFGRNLEAAAVFSDFIQVAGGEPAAAARRARAARVALLPVVFGGRVEAPDVAVRSPGGRRMAFVGQQLRIDAEISARNTPPLALTVELLEEGRVLQRRELNLTAGQTGRASFDLPAAEAGFRAYQVRVPPFAGEPDRANNSCTVGAVVIDARMRVLAIEGNPSWDGKFLVQALRGDPHVDLRSILRLTEGRFFCVEAASGTYYSGGEKTAFPSTREELDRFDVVILGRNVEYFVSPEQASLLRDFVAERGGGLIMARGRSCAADIPELAEIEPVVWGGPASGEARLVPTRLGGSMPFFAPAGGDGAGRGAMAPGLPPVLVGQEVQRVKPFCDVLARAQSVTVPAPAGTPAGAGGEATPAIVARRFGMGTVCLVNAEGLWKWAFLPPGKKELAEVYPHFWGQLLRWVAGNGDFLPGQDFSFSVSSAAVAPGQPLRFSVAARRERVDLYRPEISVRRGADEVLKLSPGQAAGETAVWSAAAAIEEPGEYRAVLVNNTGQPPTMEIPLTVTARRGESDELSADREMAARLAAMSDGLAGDADAAAAFAVRRLADRAARADEESRFRPLWDRAAVLLFIALAAGAEWAVRRRGGLL